MINHSIPLLQIILNHSKHRGLLNSQLIEGVENV
jgi:hypothetical protein